jgi:hypothetical protein
MMIYKEFSGADAKVRAKLVVGLVIFLCGVGLVSVAPVWTRT